ncbi:MAG: von Willebrand factor type A domain-containing protein, partial [Rubripirellula sp.]
MTSLSNPEQTNPDQRHARATDYVFGELSGIDLIAFEKELEQSSELQSIVASIRETVSALETEFAEEALPMATLDREKIAAAIVSPDCRPLGTGSSRQNFLIAAVAIAASLILALGLLWPPGRQGLARLVTGEKPTSQTVANQEAMSADGYDESVYEEEEAMTAEGGGGSSRSKRSNVQKQIASEREAQTSQSLERTSGVAKSPGHSTHPFAPVAAEPTPTSDPSPDARGMVGGGMGGGGMGGYPGGNAESKLDAPYEGRGGAIGGQGFADDLSQTRIPHAQAVQDMLDGDEAKQTGKETTPRRLPAAIKEVYQWKDLSGPELSEQLSKKRKAPRRTRGVDGLGMEMEMEMEMGGLGMEMDMDMDMGGMDMGMDMMSTDEMGGGEMGMGGMMLADSSEPNRRLERIGDFAMQPSALKKLEQNIIQPQQPEPTSGRDRFAAIYDNAFETVTDEPLSTFSIDVDTAA